MTVAAIRRGHAWVAESADVDLVLEATLGDRTVSCGDHLGAEPADLVDVRLTASGVPGSVAQLRGSMSRAAMADPAGFERANYVRTLMSWSSHAQVSPGQATSGEPVP